MAQIPDMYQISMSGLFSLGIGSNDDQGVVANTYYWSDTWAKAFNKHTLRAGTEISRYQLNRFNRFVQRGVVTLGSTSGSGGCPPACTAFQDFLLGRATGLQVGGGDPGRYFRAKDIAFFAQDDFRVSSRLTVNLGLRWEGMGYTKEVFNRMATYDINLALAGKNPFTFPQDLNYQGFTGNGNKVPDCMIAKCFDTSNWAPRVGFALDLFGDKKTVLRGGYGLYYQRISNQTVLQTSLAPPFTVQAIDSRPDGNPGGILAAPWASFPALVPPQLSRFAGLVLSGTNTPTTNANDPSAVPVFVNDAGQRCIGFPSNVTGASNCAISTASFTVPPQGFYTPYNQQWNLTVQRDLLRGWALEMGYLGAHYVGGLGIYNPYVRLASPSSPITVQDINGTSYTITTNTVSNEPLRFGALGLARSKGARFAGNIGWALYHSGQVTVSHRFDKGLFFQAGYTWSKTLDDVSGSMGGDELNVTRNGQGGANLFNLGNLNPALNKARGDFDRPHRLVVSYSYDLPVPKSGIWGSQAFQGWSLSGITYFQSGLPFSVPDPTGGGAYGSGGSSSPMLICSNALAKALPTSTVPTCTPGAPTTVEQAIMPGDVQQNVNFYLNPNMFSANTTAPFSAGSGATTYGNVPRNAFRGPFQQSWDMSISKRFRITEKDRLSFRADFFNAFNHPVFRAPATVSIGTPATMSQITNTAVPARLIQFGLKYEH
jgi:hypothetical protein